MSGCTCAAPPGLPPTQHAAWCPIYPGIRLAPKEPARWRGWGRRAVGALRRAAIGGKAT